MRTISKQDLEAKGIIMGCTNEPDETVSTHVLFAVDARRPSSPFPSSISTFPEWCVSEVNSLASSTLESGRDARFQVDGENENDVC